MSIAVESVRWNNGELTIIDQTLLPEEVKYIQLKKPEDVWQAINRLAVRGAPAIGIAAAYGLVLKILNSGAKSAEELISEADQTAEYLKTSRPTAVNLSWAVERLLTVMKNSGEQSPDRLSRLAEQEAIRIHREDKEICRSIGKHGSELITRPVQILTHCNTGGLATGQFGTAFSVIFHAHQNSNIHNVWVDETRPLLQGARLTTWELMQADIPFSLISDSMAGMVMQQNAVDMIIVGTDRVAANGDTANKIGTYSLAVLAQYHRIPFYVAAPVSSIDFSISHGDDIPIEERESREITHIKNQAIAPADCPVYNPAFDVTPASLISGFITEFGVIAPPFEANLRKLRGRVLV